ncbi:MAG TPA: outer membrane lipoprotein-sorting protein [Verrucomicrobiae bacterium]|jgi:outer membrane lipoprotein-sorting protein|nr:outer membrane lipoprotein-sorting protein [Verrucomicrobiae bacterium]
MRRFFLILAFLCLSRPAFAEGPDVSKMLADMDQVLRGHSHDMTVTLHVKTAQWERDYKIRVWMKGVDFTFARVLSPSKVEGQGFLRLQSRLWQYLPTAERTILIPPSLMLDDFMGSDFSNDDFVKLSYLPRDYDGTVAGEETLDGFECYHLTLTPHPDAPVTYSKLEVWLRKKDSAPVKWDFYDEKMRLIRTLHYTDFKLFGEREVPSVWRMENHAEKDHETTLTIQEAKFDLEIPDSLFTREKLEKYP